MPLHADDELKVRLRNLNQAATNGALQFPRVGPSGPRGEQIEYREAGVDYYEQRYRERLLNSLKKKATELGFNLIPIQEVH